MESLFTDVILFISNNYLEKNKYKLSFLSCVPLWHTLKSKVHFRGGVTYNERLESFFYYKNLNIRYVMSHNKFKSIPKHTKLLCLPTKFNQPLEKGDIPNSVTTLKFGNHFDQPLKKGDIPNSVTTLNFWGYFNQPLKKGDIPDSITTLKFGWNFNQPLKKGDIPNSVTTLVFGFRFNQTLKPGDIPNSVTTLTFGNHFKQPLSSDNIPNSVKEIFLTKAHYILPIPNSLLNRVTYK
jgi:hypothetical protein